MGLLASRLRGFLALSGTFQRADVLSWRRGRGAAARRWAGQQLLQGRWLLAAHSGLLQQQQLAVGP